MTNQPLRFYAVSALLCAALAAFQLPLRAGSGTADPPAAWRGMEEAVLGIQGADGSSHRLEVRVADESAERAQGMQHLAADIIRNHPIWFVFDEPRAVGWHMHNVRLALDIVYFDARGRFIARERMAPGGSGYGIPRRIGMALELAAGQADRYGLTEGATARLR